MSSDVQQQWLDRTIAAIKETVTVRDGELATTDSTTQTAPEALNIILSDERIDTIEEHDLVPHAPDSPSTCVQIHRQELEFTTTDLTLVDERVLRTQIFSQQYGRHTTDAQTAREIANRYRDGKYLAETAGSVTWDDAVTCPSCHTVWQAETTSDRPSVDTDCPECADATLERLSLPSTYTFKKPIVFSEPLTSVEDLIQELRAIGVLKPERYRHFSDPPSSTEG